MANKIKSPQENSERPRTRNIGLANYKAVILSIHNLHYEKFQDGTVKCIEDETPFEVPDGWEWCRLKNLFNVCSAKRVLQSEWKDAGIPFYRAREIVKLANSGYVNNDLYVSIEHYEKLRKTYGVPQAGDLMITGVGTIGKVYIVKDSMH